jgi:hypothetical protein
VQRKIRAGPFQPIAEVTKRRRLERLKAYQKAKPAKRAKMMADWLAGDFTPLIDTGQLRQAVTYIIDKKKSR